MKRVITVACVAWLSATAVAVLTESPAAVAPFRLGESRQPAENAPAQDVPSASMWGTVRDAAGNPVDGALVSIRGVDQTFTTSVFTDESGEYVSPPLTARRYRMWAQATGFATSRSDLALNGGPASQSFRLTTIEDIAPQLTGSEWLDILPTATAEDRRMKQILRTVCSDCHSLAVVLQNRFDEPGWRMLVRAMAKSSHTGWRKESAGFLSQIVDYHADEIASYLAKVRGPGPSPLKLAPRARPRGAAARAVMTDYDVPIGERRNELAWFDGSDWSQGPAVGMHGIAGPHDVVADPSGIAWIYEGRTSFETHRTLLRLDPRTGHMTGFAALRGDDVISSEQVTLDPSGHIWSSRLDGAMRWSPITETMTVFPAPEGMPYFVNSLNWDSAGRIWLNHFGGGSARLDPTTEKWENFIQRTPFDGFSYGMAVDADDNAWWSAWNGDMVVKADVKTGEITEIPMRDPEYDERKALATPADLEYYASIGSLTGGGLSANPVPYANTPRRMSADKRGTTVWVPNWAGGNIAEIDIRTLEVTYHKLPVTGNAYKTDVDNQHNVWASVPLADSLVKYDSRSRSWTVYPFATHGCGPRHVSVDRERGEVWVPCDQASKVTRFQFRTPEQIQSQKRAAQAN